ncbi:MalY/PatB family protein [Amphibacillus sediminis]|uniref:MalY/PatB family protein n=1 Tax=Amphibacillus sediminis TaxID=360185 RepID=UPI00082F09F3|nr:MalY/PatB family protein [Amphibacillus sediminis]
MQTFEQLPNRKQTRSVKWDMTEKLFGSKDVQPMWVADMDLEIAKPIKEALINRVDHGVFGYTFTDQQLNLTIAEWLYQRHGWKINPDWIVYSPGVLTTIHMAVITQTVPDDKIVIQTPVYPPFHSIVKSHQRQLIENPLIYQDGKYKIDFEDLEQSFASGAKAMILCSPHNPVGRVWSKDELLQISQLAEKYNVLIISDEIHADLIYKESTHIPISSLNEQINDQTITCFSPTKTFNLAGLQVSYAIIPNESLRLKINNAFKQYGISEPNTLGFTALEAAYQHGTKWLEQLIQLLHQNRELVERSFRNRSEITPIHAQGTYLIWLDCTEMKLEHEALVSFMAKEAKIGLNDGISFGANGKGFMRMNIASPTSYVEAGVQKIIAALDRLAN